MIAALALAGLLGAAAAPRVPPPAAGPGRVVLAGEPFELAEPLARELARGGVLELVAADGADAPRMLARSGAPHERVEIDLSRVEPARDADLAARVRAARSVVLAGGEPIGWAGALVPGGFPSRLGLAVREAHAAGATVAAAGPVAPLLGAWLALDRAALRKPARNPRDAREDLFVDGLDLVRGAVLGTDGARGGLGVERWIDAALEGRFATAVYVDGRTAWIADPHRSTAVVAGDGSVLLLDLSGARRRREEVDGARLSVLGDGDAWDGRAGDDRGTPVAPAQPPQRADEVAALDVARLCDAARAATPALRVRTPRFELALAPDEATRVVASEGRPATVLRLRLDLVRRAPEPPAR